MLDADSWNSPLGTAFQRLCVVILVLGLCLMVLLMTGDYPFGPISLFAFVTPLFLITMKQPLMPHIRTRVYLSWLSGPLFFVSVVNGFVWFVWTFLRNENEFNDATKVAFAQATGCEPNLEDFPYCATNSTASDKNDGLCFEVVEDPLHFIFEDGCDHSCTADIYDDCLNAFILWGGPLLVSMVLFFLSFFCTFLRSENSERDILNFGKLWIFLIFAMWLTASLAGVASGLASALAAMTLASFVGSAIFIASSRSREESKAQAHDFWARINENYGAQLDIARGLFLITCFPILVIYIVLSFFNQLVRKIGLPCSKRLKTPEVQKDFITKRCRRQITTIQSWNRSKILTYAIYWGIAFMILYVIVAQFTVLFLSWLIEKTSDFNLGAVTAILCFVGMIMFLLPPVPGVPIYLTLGIVVVATGRDLLGIVGAIVYASAVSLALKLVACTAQQKLIGENMSKSVSVRKLVQINSTLIRAMRLILAEPGMGPAKVSMLVGGPDWPTSVLCGIMRLDLFPVLFGTLPVFFLILPTVLTGAFTYMANLRTDEGDLEFPW
jgi:hypothetical protein